MMKKEKKLMATFILGTFTLCIIAMVWTLLVVSFASAGFYG